VAVLDARRLSEGPLARVQLGQAVPFTFHGQFVPAEVH
jgi:carotenoid cleavage dioxygenase-like enzyme